MAASCRRLLYRVGSLARAKSSSYFVARLESNVMLCTKPIDLPPAGTFFQKKATSYYLKSFQLQREPSFKKKSYEKIMMAENSED